MSLIPDYFLKRVVTIGKRTAHAEQARTGSSMDVCGTGFLYVYSSKTFAETNKKDRYTFVVTCKHVIDDVRLSPSNSVFLGMNLKSGGKRLTLEIPASIDDSVGWQSHPSADIAVFGLNWGELMKYDPDYGAFYAGASTLTRKEV